MALSATDRDALMRVHLVSGKSLNETREFFESLFIYAMLQHAEGKPVVLPYVGTLTLTHTGDVLEREGRVAQVEVDTVLDPMLVRSIGQFVDGDTTEADNILLDRIRKDFQVMEEESQP